MFRYGQYCYVDTLGQCNYWFKTWGGRSVVIATKGKETFPAWVDTDKVIEIKFDKTPPVRLPDWARQDAVSRDWTRKYPR